MDTTFPECPANYPTVENPENPLNFGNSPPETRSLNFAPSPLLQTCETVFVLLKANHSSFEKKRVFIFLSTDIHRKQAATKIL